MVITKRCSKCSQELPLSEFNKNRNTRDGLQDKCRACFSEYNRNRYRSDREKFKDAVRRREIEDPHAVLVSRLTVYTKKPTHQNAYRCVEAAIRAGVIAKPHWCSDCGGHDHSQRQWAIHAHHPDYSEPLLVEWYCPKCHGKRHRGRKKEVAA